MIASEPGADLAPVATPVGEPKRSPLAVLGAGAWGTALAVVLASDGTPVRLWSHRAEQAAALDASRQNAAHLPGVELPISVRVTPDLIAAITSAAAVLVATPVVAVRPLCQQLAQSLDSRVPVIWAAKGMELGSGYWLHEILAEVLPAQPCAVLSGPTFAAELARGQPSAAVVAARDAELARALAELIRRPTLRCYSSTDVIGVEVGGAVKNVLAIAAGVAEGLGLGANARAALVTRGLAEMRRLGVALGAEPATFMGLAGVGDLMLTCTDNQSRNRRFGLALAAGQSTSEATAQVAQVVEGARTAGVLMRLARELGVELPICAEVAAIIVGETAPKEALRHLLAREAGNEV